MVLEFWLDFLLSMPTKVLGKELVSAGWRRETNIKRKKNQGGLAPFSWTEFTLSQKDSELSRCEVGSFHQELFIFQPDCL